jgi:ribosomal protein S18 acetylase RimI-like enzyme
MDSVIIRKATVADMDALLKFEQGVISAERPCDPTLSEGPIKYYDIMEMISAPHIELLVAELDHVLIGCGYARIQQPKPYFKHTSYAYLGFMYVDPRYRGRSVNRQIVEALKSWTISCGIHEIRLEVYHENINAVKAYEAEGFKKIVIEMRMGLDKG